MQQHKLDFDILDTEDSKSLMFLDKSDYFKRPEYPLIEIKFPNSTKTHSLIIDSCGFKNITTKELCISKEILDLQDGIYTIKYSVAPNDKVFLEKKFLKTAKLVKKFQDILKNTKIDEKAISILYKIDLYLQAAKINLNIDESASVEYYRAARSILNNIEHEL